MAVLSRAVVESPVGVCLHTPTGLSTAANGAGEGACASRNVNGAPWHLVEMLENLTGVGMHEDTWLKTKVRRAELERQTDALCWKLEQSGVEVYRADPNRVVVMGLCSGGVEDVAQRRNINFLPAVAAANRSGMLKDLTYFADSHPNLRYWVVTNGPRCTLENVRERICDLSRCVSKFAAQSWMKDNDIEVVFRGVECTFRREPGGKITVHPHANLLLWPKRHLGGEKWSEVLAKAHAYFGWHFADNGRLVSPDEAVKYPFKPAEMEGLTGEELAELREQLHGLKLIQPMASFARMRRDLEAARLRVGKARDRSGVWRWVLVRRPSLRPRDTPVEAPDVQSGQMESELKELGSANPPKDLVLGLSSPQPRFAARMEPVLRVVNPTCGVAELCDRNGLGDLLAAARRLWAEREGGREAALESTHTRQLSGPSGLGTPGREYRLKNAVDRRLAKEKAAPAWAAALTPSMMERLYPESAKLQRERKQRRHALFGDDGFAAGEETSQTVD